jgi:hypothetical protein
VAKKLDWFPLYVNRILASRRWQQMKDYQRGWYITLLIAAADSEKPGYLPLTQGLWELAGASSEGFFKKESVLVMQCFKAQEIDGREWIYNERLLLTLKEQSEKVEKKRVKHNPQISLTSISALVDVFERAYKNYPLHVGKRAAEKAFAPACSRIAAKQAIDIMAAGEFIAMRASEYAQTPAGQRGKYTPHMSTWLNRDSFSDDSQHWEVSDGENKAQSNQDKQRDDLAELFRMSAGVDGESDPATASKKPILLANPRAEARVTGGLGGSGISLGARTV